MPSLLQPERVLVTPKSGKTPYWSTRYRRAFVSQAGTGGISVIKVEQYKGDINQLYQAWSSFVAQQPKNMHQQLLLPVLAIQDIAFQEYNGLFAIQSNRIVGVASFEIKENIIDPSIISSSPYDILQGRIRSISQILENKLTEYANKAGLTLQKDYQQMSSVQKFSSFVKAARSGLIPKKVTVHREGKTFQSTRWVKPEVGQIWTPGKVRIPPGWTNVQVNQDPKAALQATGYDVKGRKQYLYSKQHSAKAASAKFKRLKDFNKAIPKINSIIEKNAIRSEEAAVLYLINKTAFRIGSDKETLAQQKAYGTSTLEGRHIKIDGDTIHFNFVGKKGVEINKTISDPLLAKILQKRNRGPNNKLFNTTDGLVRGYLHRISKDKFTIKDYRTWHGTRIALEEIQKMPHPKTKREFSRFRHQVGQTVANFLGNTAGMALGAYIAPEVFSSWKASLEMS